MEPLLAQKDTALRPTLSKDEPRYEAGGRDRSEDGEVQLLRLRTKKHEIIVYPDAKFLCCVVSRSGQGQGQSNGAG